ncbi:MAG: repair protein RecO protein [Candidatus Wolfebacteria bacterium GW2011_GWC2_46_275]|uniref:Repair protein RecO protein n=2 Tax=Candidatus Wolfeibacteriota TaxID=1752735 RepID=A0A0G1WH96_9BACT|nr:MAG: repair protein RecO, DNA repair protein RecO (recombination protein O) protein [Candidatus Wolfebacteria bacterium GW2011_GWB1_47_1]KKU34573.1 MAG: repair protein RecO protein [Candidatus Wolfebacteria bacterium GW2011_GWC2_46_275]KKU41889.1 MAG: repair protein RecO protein [Candidatus Wolfebacteria bacterium GW2011_GWB2_46_69]KKU54167.1 MAG: repair protein RecO protein [Candidatus Wolfebacteria bacterium GW2011_GWC1_47_103]KKU59090.1 MAG: repair protein RecO protein [Candidatus Wolfeba
MIEHYTEAFVLDREDFKEHDGIVHLYTEELGKVSARARGLKKILSKSSAHLEPLNFVRVRLMSMKSGYYQIIDVMPHDTISVREKKKDVRRCSVLLAMAEFIRKMTYELHPDEYLWDVMKRLAGAEADEGEMYRALLKAFGFDPQYATCTVCQHPEVSHFLHDDHGFYCRHCASKMSANAIVL